MTQQTLAPAETPALPPGSVLELDTPAGPRHMQVLFRHPPYPEVVRLIRPVAGAAASPEAIARQDSARVAMIEAASHLRQGHLRCLGWAPIPAHVAPDAGFRVPIRDRNGDPLYFWLWNRDGLHVAPPQDVADLPVREILPLDRVKAILAALD